MIRKNLFFVFIFIMLFTGCSTVVIPENVPEVPAVENKVSVDTVVYYADETFYNLEGRKVTFDVKKEEDKFIETLKLLMVKPGEDGLVPTLSEKTVINSVKVENGLCTVDFTESLTEYNTGGSSKETMCLYSVVNTLCGFNEIDEVIFTVDGSNIETFGQLDMTEPYGCDMSNVKEN